MSREILYPSEVVAYRHGANNEVTIVAKGREDGYCKIQIEASMAQIYPPIYMVTAEPCAVIGDFPYTVHKTVRYSTDLDYVNFQMGNGTERIPIHDIMESEGTPEALTSVADDEVTGIAYYSSNMQDAIDNAIKQLRVKFPDGGINAKVVDSGFVTTKSPGPFGMAYFYVKMKQQA